MWKVKRVRAGVERQSRPERNGSVVSLINPEVPVLRSEKCSQLVRNIETYPTWSL